MLPAILEPFRKRIEATVKPYVQIQTQVCKDTSLWQSKFLGRPYLPKFADFPRTSQGEYLYLLAQINFAEAPALSDFPSKGILQFYLANKTGYGLGYDRSTRQQDGFRVIYHSEPTMDKSKLMTDFSFMPSPWDEDYDGMPFDVRSKYLQKSDSCLALTFQRKAMTIGPQDYRYEAVIGCDLYDFTSNSDDREIDCVMNDYGEMFHGHRLGGYPTFTQLDPRTYIKKEEEPYILLLQVDSEDNNKIDIRWGDLGICNFFIKQSALNRLDFSDVLYYWDCS